MHDANEMKCLIFEIARKKYCFRKSNKNWGFRCKQKINYHYFLTVGSYRPQPLMNRVNLNNYSDFPLRTYFWEH